MRVILGKLDILLHLQLSSKLNTFPRDEDENSSYTAMNTVGCSPPGVHLRVFTNGRSPSGAGRCGVSAILSPFPNVATELFIDVQGAGRQ